MKIRFSFILAAAFFLKACSGGFASDGTADPGTGTNSVLRSVTISGDVLQSKTLFASYSKRASRVSIIDPINKVETWGRQVGVFQFAVALPDFSGAVLFGDNRIEVDSGSASKTFRLAQEYPHVAVALDQAAYSFSSLDGRTFELVRSLGNGKWQHQTFNVPWGILYPDLNEPVKDQPMLLVTYFNHNGSLLAVFSPVDGRYAVYTAASTTDSLVLMGDWCAGDGVGTPDNASFTSLAWDETATRFYAGDKLGNVYAFDPFAGCANSLNADAINVSNRPIVNISVKAGGQLAVIADDDASQGLLQGLQYDANGFSLSNFAVDKVCDTPIGAMYMQNENIVVACWLGSSNRADIQSPELFTNVELYSYKIFNTLDSVLLNDLVLDKKETAGVAIDIENAIIYRMLEGAFGSLQSVNLMTGAVSSTEGILLKGILNE